MDTLDGIEKIAEIARKQEIPKFSVSDQVITTLTSDKDYNFIVFDFFAGVFATLASVGLYIGINAWMYLINPLTQFFAPLQEVRLW